MDREQILKFWGEIKTFDKAVEIGVYRGYYADKILNLLRPKQLFLIDPWEANLTYADARFLEPGYNAEKWESTYHGVLKLFLQNNNVHVLRMKSIEAAKQFDDESLDFIYIDGDHELEAVDADIKTWFPKLRQGGIMAGHDFDLWNVFTPVEKFFKQKKIQIHKTGESIHPSFWIKKPYSHEQNN